MRKCGIVEMRERLPRCTYSFSHFPNIPIFSLPYSHILTLHSANYVDLVLKLAAFGSHITNQRLISPSVVSVPGIPLPMKTHRSTRHNKMCPRPSSKPSPACPQPTMTITLKRSPEHLKVRFPVPQCGGPLHLTWRTSST